MFEEQKVIKRKKKMGYSWREISNLFQDCSSMTSVMSISEQNRGVLRAYHTHGLSNCSDLLINSVGDFRRQCLRIGIGLINKIVRGGSRCNIFETKQKTIANA